MPRLSKAALAALALAALAASPARAEVSRFEVLSRQQPALGGRAFGPSGTAEKITARATVALDPANPWDPLESTCRHASLSIL